MLIIRWIRYKTRCLCYCSFPWLFFKTAKNEYDARLICNVKSVFLIVFGHVVSSSYSDKSGQSQGRKLPHSQMYRFPHPDHGNDHALFEGLV